METTHKLSFDPNINCINRHPRLNLDVYWALDGSSLRCISSNSSPLSTWSSINSMYVVESGIPFLAKKYMDLINLRIIIRFFFFCSSACLAAPVHYISMIFCYSTCSAILTEIDKSWCHLDPCCFSSSVAWFQSTITLVFHPPCALGDCLLHFVQWVQNMPTLGSSH